MGFLERPVGELHAGTWTWWVKRDRFVGDDTIADLFNVDRRLLEEGVPIELIRTALHPDDLDFLLSRAQNAIDNHVPYQARFRVRRRDGLVRSVASFGHCFFDQEQLVQFSGTTIEIAPERPPEPSLDQLTEQVIAACETARFLGEPFRLHLLEMVLADIGRATASRMMGSMIMPSSH